MKDVIMNRVKEIALMKPYIVKLQNTVLHSDVVLSEYSTFCLMKISF